MNRLLGFLPRLLSALLSVRAVNGGLLGLCLAAFAAVYYLDGVLGLAPCPLCIIQRLFLGACAACLLAATLHGPGPVGQRIYAGLAAFWALGGGAVAARHVWLQYLPPELVPACGPGLAYMLEALPPAEILQLLLAGDGDCAAVQWRFAGLSIPEQSLALFTGLATVNLWQLVRGLNSVVTVAERREWEGHAGTP